MIATTDRLISRSAPSGAAREFTPGGQQVSVKYLATVMALLGALVLPAIFTPAIALDDFSPKPLKVSEIERRYFFTSLYTRHYDPKPEHNNDQKLIGFETGLTDRDIWGIALFDNSFGQDSQYLYVGRKYRAFDSDQWYYKLTGGMLHGYKEPYEDKIPLNDLGVAPAIIPAIGYHHKNFAAEFVQLGLSAGMITVGLSF